MIVSTIVFKLLGASATSPLLTPASYGPVTKIWMAIYLAILRLYRFCEVVLYMVTNNF